MKICKDIILLLVLIHLWHILAIAAQYNNCPDPETILPCRCSLKGKETQIWCSHSNLPQIMEGIRSVERTSSPESVDELILENNQLPALPGRFFGALRISRLMLRHNSIERVSNGWLNELQKNLVEIFIVEPKLRSIPPESLIGFQRLEAITIHSNELKRLPNFSGLLNLKYLSVNSKSLIELPPSNIKHLPKLQNVHINGGENMFHLEGGLFDNLPSLKTIDLSRNRINTIHLRAFYNLPNLVNIKLSQNKINDANMVGRALKDLQNLQKLRLDNNVINVLTEGSFVDLQLLTELYLNDNKITEIQYGSFHQIPNLKVIYLQNNNIRRIHPESFMHPSGNGVESLYLYNNEIERIEEVRSILNALPLLKFLDLTQNHLSEIPFGALRGHGTIEQLHLNDNIIRIIDRDALMAMPALRELRLRNNSISDNLGMPFWNLPGLKGLDLAQNQFRHINAVLLAGLPSLRRLDLSQNLLTTLDPTTFIHSPMLETLNISFNEIKTIHPATFRNLDRLFEVDISENQLQEIVPGLPRIVERLSLRRNMISILPTSGSKSLNLPNLRMLDISNNVVEYIPKYSFQSLNQLRVLSFAQNRIRAIEDTTFIGTDRLELLHIQNNQINEISEISFQSMKDLKNLNLQGNKIENLPELAFSNNTNLDQLDLSRNNLKELPPLIFQNLKYLQFLDVSNNILSAMPESLSHLISLKDLDMSFNQLMYLPSIIINAWKNAVEIRLSNNRFHELKKGTVSNLPKLQYLDLSSNEIDTIETGALRNLPDLQELVLADNKLVELKDHVFENLSNLLAAHLQHNGLQFISPHSFFQSPAVVYLNLSMNNFNKMENVGLRTMRSLEVLDLSGNNIRTVKTMPLKTLNWLVELKMDNNQICKIHGSPFETMPRLRVLSIRNNKLKIMHERTFRNLRGNIAILDVDGNPIQCSCDMLWLSVWLDETNSPNPGPKCQNGKLLRASRFEKNECNNDLRASNQLPLLNEHGDLFSRQLNEDFNEECEDELFEGVKQNPLPSESEYFYDQYIDYPTNETHETINNNLTQNTQFQSASNSIKPNHISANSNIDLNNTVLNYNHYNRPRPNLQNSSPFTFFGYPLPSLGFGRYLGPNARKTDANNAESLTVSNRGKVRMFMPNDSDLEKYLNQETQYHDITSRNRFIESDSNENPTVEDRSSFKTSFKNPKPERGGFLPIIPGHVGGFIPVQPYRKKDNQTQSLAISETTKNGNNIYSNFPSEKYTSMIPIKPIPIKSITKKNSIQQSSTEKNTTNILLGERISTLSTPYETSENDYSNQSMTSHSYLETEYKDSQEIKTGTTIKPESIEDSINKFDDFFPPTSTSETILLIPPVEEQQQEEQLRNKDLILTDVTSSVENSLENIDENSTINSKTRPQIKTPGSRSRIIKVFTPQSLLNLPTAEEYFRTTINPNSDNDYQSNEFVTSTYQIEESSKKVGMEWYYDNYKNKNRKIEILNEIETVRPIRKNNSNKIYNQLCLLTIMFANILLNLNILQ